MYINTLSYVLSQIYIFVIINDLLYQMMIILELQVIMGPSETGGVLGIPVLYDPSQTNLGAAHARPTPPGKISVH